ncbi:MAG: hypothetical protein AAF992_23820, partial [Bacteroidota bacterium]
VANRVEFTPKGILHYLSKYPHLSRVFGWVSMVGSTFLFIDDLGLAKGIFTSLVLWPMLASLIILLVPFFYKTPAKN